MATTVDTKASASRIKTVALFILLYLLIMMFDGCFYADNNNNGPVAVHRPMIFSFCWARSMLRLALVYPGSISTTCCQ